MAITNKHALLAYPPWTTARSGASRKHSQAHGDFCGAIAREQHIGGLEVKVDDALVMQVVQPARYLHRYPPAPALPCMTLSCAYADDMQHACNLHRDLLAARTIKPFVA